MEKSRIPTGDLMRTFDRYTQAARNERPIFVRFKDGKLIKHALTWLNESQISMLFAWFLQEKKDMRPTIGAALCKEVISDFIETSERRYGFYAELESLVRRLDGGPAKTLGADSTMTDALKKLKNSFTMR